MIAPSDKEPEIKVTDADEQEWADYDKIKVEDGLDLIAPSKAATEHFERIGDSPMMMIDTPLPYKAWGGIAAIIKDQIRATMSPELQEARGWAYFFCERHYKNKMHGLRPAHEQWQFSDMMQATGADRATVKDAGRCQREAIYRFFHNEYLARGVG